ncbi:MAG: T9SS type A sorting domain-containing protein [Bacteroidales bacterium]|nr:T9SS type A sorting domain-containing protein [Bacteroidales bacterium]
MVSEEHYFTKEFSQNDKLTRNCSFIRERLIFFIPALILITFLIYVNNSVYAAETNYTVLDYCETLTGWTGPHGFELDGENSMEGNACVSSTGEDLVSFSKTYTPHNTYLSEENGYLKFWFYISDASLYDNTGQIEITSSGSFDVDEYSWNLNNIYISDGWNYLVLSFASANKNGSPDLSAINFFRIYGFYSDVVTLKIDEIIFSYDMELPLPGQVFDKCNYITGWSGNDEIVRDPYNKMEGTACISSNGDGTNRFIKSFIHINANVGFEKGYLNFWLYVSDISRFEEAGQVEITSSGGSDVDEYSWPIKCMNLKNGWNHVFLKLSEANVSGSPDLTLINYFRFYNFMTDSVLLRIDDIRFTENLPQKPVKVNPNTLNNKVLFGYQGWFAAPGDSSLHDHWVHWFKNNIPDADNATFDCWPDLSEYDEDELFTTDMEYFFDGGPAKLYSAYRYKTVDRHFRWMKENQLDGVFLQRFISNTRYTEGLDFVDKVTDNVMKSCEKYERVFAIEFCIQEGETWWVEQIKSDWMHLVDDLNIILNPYYLKHKGRPLIGIYGIGFEMYSYATPSEAQELIDWFHFNAPDKYRATVMTGVPATWRTDAEYIDFYSTVDVIKPWSVGRYDDVASIDGFLNQYIAPDKEFCDNHGIDYIPVIWPGFSWYNLQRDGEYQKNQFPRYGGEFYWRQSYNVNRADVNMIFIAMYDEVDEGTAMYKIEPSEKHVPTEGFWVTLDIDEYDLPSDWYLRLSCETGRVLRNEIANDNKLPAIPNTLGVDTLHISQGIYPQTVIPEEMHGCEGETKQVSAIVFNALWQNWSTGSSDIITDVYCDYSKEVWLVAGNSCGNSSDTMSLIVHSSPTINLGVVDTVSGDESLTVSLDDNYVRYLWDDEVGDTAFIANSSSLNPGLNEIVLTVVDHNGCKGYDLLFVYLEDGGVVIRELNETENLNIYPNPCIESVNLVFSSSELSEINLSLFDIEGHKVYSEMTKTGKTITLKTDKLVKGNYFLHIKIKDYNGIVTIVKN